MPHEQSIELVGIEGFGRLRDVDATAIAEQQVKEALKRLPEERRIEIFKDLPENIIKEICNQGVSAELAKWTPAAIVFIASALIMYGYVTQEVLIIAVSALGAGALTYWLTNDTLFSSEPQMAAA
jgi:hypothetical protein